MTFCDVAGLRAIVRLADSSAPVVLHAVPGPVLTVLNILGWDQEPGLVISTCRHDPPRHDCA